jgi:RNA polymerase sigma-54 factor
LSFTQELSMVPRFGLEVSPALVSFAEMLMLPYAAMQTVIEEELCSNSALERVDAGECPICSGQWRTRCPVCAGPANGPSGVAKGNVGKPADLAAAESDSDALLRAVRMETPAADMAIVEYLVESLDVHGLLDRSCADLAAELGVEELVVANVVDVIRRVGPPGVGATSVTECLLLQLDALGLDEETAALARAVTTAHLPALAKGRFTSIAASLGVTTAEIKQVLELIRGRLRPYPAFDGNPAPVARYVVPDLVVREHDEIPGEFAVDLVEPALTRLSVRPNANGRSNAPEAPAAGSDGSVSQARSFIAQLGDRWETLRRVAECAIERQKDFLVGGAGALKPLTRAEVAAELDLHESTVSRTVADKYALLPDRTIVPLSRFFGASGGVDGELQKLLESADGGVSDQRLADMLREAGYPIARRTVAKHRARLGYTTAALR